MSLYLRLNSCFEQHPLLVCAAYPWSPAQENHAREVCAHGDHQWTWDKQPTDRHLIILLARLQRLSAWLNELHQQETLTYEDKWDAEPGDTELSLRPLPCGWAIQRMENEPTVDRKEKERGQLSRDKTSEKDSIPNCPGLCFGPHGTPLYSVSWAQISFKGQSSMVNRDHGSPGPPGCEPWPPLTTYMP